MPRLKNYPGGAGKGFDTAVLLAWLLDECEPGKLESVPEPWP